MLIINKAALVAIALAMASGASLAGPIVTAWNYENNAVFTAANFSTDLSGSENHTAYELSWGATGGSFIDPLGGRSALTIGDGTSGTIMGGGPAMGSVDTVIGDNPPTASEIGVGINMSHWNNPIWVGYNKLLSGTLYDTLTLTPTAGGPSADTSPLEFNFAFLETPNSAPCAGGTANPCGDLLGIVGIPDLNPGFEYEGHDYMASIFITDGLGGTSPIGPLLDGECDALFGTGYSGCLGWLTDENAITTVQFGFTISNVPEPAILALMSLGLFGLGYGRYKTRTA